MRLRLAVVCLLVACGASAQAQNGISNARDVYGNIARDTGASRLRGINQGPANNGPINNAPAQPSTTNSRVNRGTIR
jgi:hypothetical protein